MASHSEFQSNDGALIPRIGFGTYPLRDEEATHVVLSAISAGYRLIDTAVNYKNEEAIGRAVAQSNIPRSEIIIQTKLPGRDHGYDETLRSFDESTGRLGVETIDSYLIHWPNPSVNKYTDSWKAIVRLKSEGRIAHMGVSNFTREFLERIAAETGVVPVFNQVELHPYFPQQALIEYHNSYGIITQAWSPLGSVKTLCDEPIISRLAVKYQREPAQIVLRWHIQRKVLPLPKSGNSSRQKSNIDVFDFELSEDEVASITSLSRIDGRLFDGDPNTHEED